MELGSISLIVFLPLAFGVLLLPTGREIPNRVWQGVGLLATLATFVLSLQLWAGYDLVGGGFQFLEHHPWLERYGIHYFVAIDGISLMLVLLTTFLMPIVMLATWNDVERDVRSYVFFLLALETGLLGAFVSLNLFMFYVFWEVLLVPMYFLIGIFGGPRRLYAAVKFFVFGTFGSLAMLIALLILHRLNFEQSGGAPNFDWVTLAGQTGLGLADTRVALAGGDVWWRAQPFLFGLVGLAFAIKLPLFPLHTWFPDSQVEAPAAGAVVLAALLTKLGAYGFLRFALPLFPNAAIEYSGLIFGLALAGVLYGSLVAMVQGDVKRLVAYVSLAQLGSIVIGIFALNPQGLTGAVLQMVSHGLSIAALLILIGFLYQRRQTLAIAELGGIARPMPIYAALFGVAVFSLIGLPSLSGFVGEILILLGAFESAPWVAVAATAGVVFSASGLLWMYRRVMFGGVDNPENRALMDLGWRERLVVLALLIPIVWIGVYPDPVLRRVEPSVVRALRLVDSRTVVAPVEPLESAEPGVLDELATRPDGVD